MERQKGLKRARGNQDSDNESVINDEVQYAGKDDHKQPISYIADWAEHWPKNGDEIEQASRLIIRNDDEWQIWRYNNKKRTNDETAESSKRKRENSGNGGNKENQMR